MDLIKGMGNKQPQGPNRMQQKVNLSNSTAIACKECGGKIFVEGTIIRKISKLLTGAPQDMIIPIPIYLCGDCGEVIDELLPDEIKSYVKKDEK